MTNKKHNTKPVISIIGMHRSGTSLTTNLLRQLGLNLGNDNDLFPGNENNQTGYFENKQFHEINESLLEAFGGSWKKPPTLEPGWEFDTRAEDAANRATKVINAFTATNTQWGWKDPRTTLLIPFWKSLIPDVKYVICLRQPLEVASSLAKRNRISIERGVNLWDRYTRDAILATANENRHFVFYEDLLNDSTNEIVKLAAFCGLPKPKGIKTIQKAIEKELKHQNSDNLSLLRDDRVYPAQKLLYLGLRSIVLENKLRKLSPEASTNNVSEEARHFYKLIDQLDGTGNVSALEKSFAEQISNLQEFIKSNKVGADEKKHDYELNRMRTAVTHQEILISKLNSNSLNAKDQINSLKDQLNNKSSEISELQAERTNLSETNSNLASEINTYKAQLSELQNKLSDTSSEIEKTREELNTGAKRQEANNSKIVELTSKVIEKEDELLSTRATLDELSQKQSLSNNKIQELEMLLEKSSEELAAKEKVVFEKEALIQTTTEAQDQVKNKIAALKSELTRANSILTSRLAELDESKKLLRTLSNQQKISHTKKASLQSELANFKSQLMEKESALAKKQTQLDQLGSQNDALQIKLNGLNGSLNSSQRELNKDKSIINELKATLQRVQENLRKKDAEIGRLKQVEQSNLLSIDELNTQLRSEQLELKKKEKEYILIKQNEISLKQQVARLNDELKEEADRAKYFWEKMKSNQQEVDAIYASTGGKLLFKYWNIADNFAPYNSRRRQAIKKVFRLQPDKNVPVSKNGSGPVNALTASTNSVKKELISVIIPTLNAGANFENLLISLRGQAGAQVGEIIVVDSGSTDDTIKIAKKYDATVLSILPTDFSHSKSRNLGAEQATGELLLFLVQDAIPSSEKWLMSMVSRLKTNNLAAISAAEAPTKDASLFYKTVIWKHNRMMDVETQDRILKMPQTQNQHTLRKNACISNVACLVKKDVFDEYSFRGEYGEDIDLGLRLIKDGHQLGINGTNPVYHSHDRSIYSVLQRSYIDEAKLAELLPDRSALAVDPERIISEIQYAYQAINYFIFNELPKLPATCSINDLAKFFHDKFRKSLQAAEGGKPNYINGTSPHIADAELHRFISILAKSQSVNLANGQANHGAFFTKLENDISSVLDYLTYNYKEFHEALSTEFQGAIFRIFAQLTGSHLASCYLNAPSHSTLDEIQIRLVGSHYSKTPQIVSVKDVGLASAELPAALNGNSNDHIASKIANRTLIDADDEATLARMIAFYLPQFHPTAQNDAWWGKGFTEWTNVTKAKPLFDGHYQPRLPGDLGFYDLRLPDARAAQAELARANGIEGFCYWHYWFNGERILERPFNEVLNSKEPDFPFCLAWANETWSKTWLGQERDILMKQSYSAEDDIAHARWLTNVFADPRNIRIKGRPVFLVYRPNHLDDAQRTTDTIRNESIKAGLPEPYLLGINSWNPNFDSRKIGFDGVVNFSPLLGVLPEVMLDDRSPSKLQRNLEFGINSDKLKIYDYPTALRLMLDEKRDYPFYPSIFVNWDNSARRGENGIIMINGSPQVFQDGLAEVVESIIERPYDDRIMFVNAWNEWAEGNNLEPDRVYGHQYLDAVKRVNVKSPENILLKPSGI